MGYASHIKPRRPRRAAASKVPVSQPLPDRDMVRNTDGGGFTFAVGQWAQLERFLILGSEGSTYYATEQKHTQTNATTLIACIKADGVRVVEEIVRVSQGGIAPKNDPAVFALALVCTHGDTAAKQAAYAAIPDVCRIGTHLYQFCDEIQHLRGWSRGLRTGVARFFTKRTPEQLAHQVIKYRQREGWSFKDVLRLAHPKAPTLDHANVYAWLTDGEHGQLPAALEAFLAIQEGLPLEAGLKLVEQYNLPWEAVPTEWHKERKLWEALLPTMLPHALIRNLSRLTALGIVDGHTSAGTRLVVERLLDAEALRKSRLHPITLFLAQRAYARGHGRHLTWTPVQRIVDTMDEAFTASFANVRPIGRPALVALDTSGSMCAEVAETGVSAYELGAAMAYVTLATEPEAIAAEFSDGAREIQVPRKAGLKEAVAAIGRQASGGGTNMSSIFELIRRRRLGVDGVVIYTDNEVNQGVHVAPQLEEYRHRTGRPTRGVVAAMTATAYSVADSRSSHWLNVVGFDLTVPTVIRWFLGGDMPSADSDD
jgi:60 kDa SS-A/Ro ribonucleoprotein